MKLIKRVMALLLCFLMLNTGPIRAFAGESVSDNDVVGETSTTIKTAEGCKECGGSDTHTEACSFNFVTSVERIAENMEPQIGDKIWIKSGS